MRSPRLQCLLGLALILPLIPIPLSALASAADLTPIPVKMPDAKAAAEISYAKNVADIVDAKCVGCHSEALAENRLNLETVANMLKGGKRGPAIAPGKADDSLLFKMAAHRMEPAMPPVAKKENSPLTPEELGILKVWIDSGAKDDSSDDPDAKAAKAITLGKLPLGVHPINAADLTPNGKTAIAGRANVVQVYDAETGIEVLALGGHLDLIQSLKCSPDGSMLAAGSYRTVTLWSMPKTTEGKTLAGHNGAVRALALAPDGQTLITAGQDRQVRLFNPATGQMARQFDGGDEINALAFAPDGKTLAVGGPNREIRLYHFADGKLSATLKGCNAAVSALAFLPDGRLVSTSDDGVCRIWTVPAQPQDKPADPIALTGHTESIHCLAIADGGKLAITGGHDRTVRVWSVADKKPIRTLDGHAGPVRSITVAPDGKHVLTGSDDKLARWYELESGRLIRALDGHQAGVTSTAIAADGKRLFAAGAEGGVKVWDAETGQGLAAFAHSAPNNQPIQPLNRVLALPDGSIATASADKTAKLWTISGEWALLRTFDDHVFRVLALDFHPDGSLLATGGGEPSRSGEIKVWEIGKGMLVRALETTHSDTVFSLKFSPDGQLLASGAADKFLKVTRWSDGKEMRSFEGHTHHVMAVDWKSDGSQLVSGGADNVLKVWSYEAGEQLRTLQAAGKQVTSARWLPGKPTVVGASGDKQVRLWNPDNGGVARTFGGPIDYVQCVAASADGQRIVAGTADGTLFLWNGENGNMIRKIDPPAPSAAVPVAAVGK